MTVSIIQRPDTSPDLKYAPIEECMAIVPSALTRAFFSFGEPPPPFTTAGADGSVAVVSIDGPLMQKGSFWFDSYEAIQSRFAAALADKNTTSVVMRISSPGGVVSGCFSATRAMRDAKVASGKPVIAYADEHAYSAAYAMASVADEIYLPAEGGVGSIGVIGTLEDFTALNEKLGIKIAVITSGAHKADGHPDVPISKGVIDRYQARIDQLGKFFAEVVGESRGMSAESVLGLEAATIYGADAVKAGLADGIANLAQTISRAQEISKQPEKKKTKTPTQASNGRTNNMAFTAPKQWFQLTIEEAHDLWTTNEARAREMRATAPHHAGKTYAEMEDSEKAQLYAQDPKAFGAFMDATRAWEVQDGR